MAAAPLVRWLNGPLLFDDGATEIESELNRLQPEGVSVLDGATVVRLSLSQMPGSEDATQIQAGTPPELAAQVDNLVERLSGEVQPNVWLVPDDPGYAIPAAYWAAQSGDVILFGGNPLPKATRQALERRGGQARVYLVGPGLESEDLSRYGTVQRIVAWDDVAAAVAIAEYRDENTGAGWGLDGSRYIANHNFVLVNRADPAIAVVGLSLGRFGKFGPLLWVERDQIPPATDQYL